MSCHDRVRCSWCTAVSEANMPKYLLTWTLHPRHAGAAPSSIPHFFAFFLKLVTIKGPLPRPHGAWRQFPDAKPTRCWRQQKIILALSCGQKQHTALLYNWVGSALSEWLGCPIGTTAFMLVVEPDCSVSGLVAL